MILLYALGLYVLIGLAVAFAFVTLGLAQVLPPATTVSPVARILFLPGATALWPYVLGRWMQKRRGR